MPNRAKLALVVAGVAIAIGAIVALRPMRVRNIASRGAAIIAFGDSLTFGYGANPGEDYPSRLSTMIGAPIVNAGVNGDTTESALARVDADVLARDPRIVLVGLGGNDLLRGSPIASTEANLHEIIRKIHGAGAMVVILGYRFPSFSGGSYEKMYERVAKEEQCLLIPDLLDGILTDPAMRSDEIHPNARGYQLMAERMRAPLSKLIRKADATR